MNKNAEKVLKETFKKSLRDTFQKGLLQGSKAIAKVIFDKANDVSKTADERIEEIKKFCSVSLGENQLGE